MQSYNYGYRCNFCDAGAVYRVSQQKCSRCRGTGNLSCEQCDGSGSYCLILERPRNYLRLVSVIDSAASHGGEGVWTKLTGLFRRQTNAELLDAEVLDHPEFENPAWHFRASEHRLANDVGPNNAIYYLDKAFDLAADEKYKPAITAFQRAAESDGQCPWPYAFWGWFYATCPDESIRNPQLALQYTRAAIKACGREQWRLLFFLAAAQAENRLFQEAVQTMDRARQLAPEDKLSMLLSLMEDIRQGKRIKDYGQVP